MLSFLFSSFIFACIASSAMHLVLRNTKAEQKAIDSIKKAKGIVVKLKQVCKLVWVVVYKFSCGLYKVPRNIYRQIAVEKFNSIKYVKKSDISSQNVTENAEQSENKSVKGKMRFRDLRDDDIYHGSAFQKFLDLIAGRDKYQTLDEHNKAQQSPEESNNTKINTILQK